MASNFDFLSDFQEMEVIAKAAANAELAFQISPYACCLLSRRAAECALFWMRENDAELRADFSAEYNGEADKANMIDMLTSFAYKARIGEVSIGKLNIIRQKGNDAVHRFWIKQGKNDAEKTLESLHYFLRYLCSKYYSKYYKDRRPGFDRSLLYYGQKDTSASDTKRDVSRSNLRKNEALEFFSSVTFADALGHLEKTEQEAAKKAVKQMSRTKKLNPGVKPLPGAEDENIFLALLPF